MARKPGTGEGMESVAHGELVAYHARLASSKKQLEDLSGTAALPESRTKIKELLRRCKSLEESLKSSDYASKNKATVENLLGHIEVGLRTLAVKKEVLLDPEKIYSQKLKKHDEDLKTLGPEIAEMEKKFGKDSAEMVGLTEKVKELIKAFLTEKSAFDHKKWNFSKNKTKEVDDLLEQFHTEMEALKAKKKVPEPKAENGADNPSQSDAEKSENRIEKRKKAERKLGILVTVRDEMMSDKQKSKISGWVTDIERCLNQAARTNDLEVYDKKMEAVGKYFGKIENKLLPQVKQEFESRVAGNPASQEFITNEQINVRQGYRTELQRLKDLLMQKQGTPGMEDKLDEVDVKIGNTRLSHIRTRADMAVALDGIKTGLGNLVAEIEALPAKGDVAPPTEPISDQQKVKLRHCRDQLVLLGGMLDKRDGEDEEMIRLESGLIRLKKNLEVANRCTDKNTLEGILQTIQGILDALRADISKLPAKTVPTPDAATGASDTVESVTSEQEEKLREYKENLAIVKNGLHTKAYSDRLKAQIDEIEANLTLAKVPFINKSELKPLLLVLDRDILQLYEDFNALPPAGSSEPDVEFPDFDPLPRAGTDVLPPLGPDLSLLTDAQRFRIDRIIPNRFRDLRSRLAADNRLTVLEPKLPPIHDKIELINSTPNAELDNLLEEILKDIEALDLEASLIGHKNYFTLLESRLEKRISTLAIDATMADLESKITEAETCTDYGKLKGLVSQIETILSGQLSADIRALPERKTEIQTRSLANTKKNLQRLRDYYLPQKVGTEAIEKKINEIEVKITSAEAVDGKNELEPLITEIEGGVTSLYEDFNDLPSPETMAEERLINYERDLTKLAEVFNNLYKDKKNVKLVNKYLGSYDALVSIIDDARNLPVTSEEESKAFLAATDNVKIKLAEFIELVKNDPNKDVYQQFQDALQGLSPESEFLDGSIVAVPEKKGIISRIGGLLGFGKKKPADTVVPPPPDKSRWERFKDAFKDKETRKFSRKVAYNTITSVLGIKTITDLGLAAFGKGDIAEWRKGTKESKVFVESIFDAYQKLLQSSERTKKGEPSALDEGVGVRLEDLKSIINDTKKISPEAKQQITERIWAISIKHQEDTDEAREERDAEVRRLLESYIHAKVSGAQIAKDGLNTLLTLGGGLFARGIGYAVGSVAERVQKARREHTYKNAGSINGESEFGFVAKDVTVRAAWETVRSLAGQGAKKGTSGTGKAMDFVKALGTIARAVGIYGSLLSSHASPGEQIDAIIDRVESGQVLKIWEEPIHNASRALESYGRVVHAVANPIETLESIKDKITGGGQTDHGILKRAMNDAVAQAHPEPIPVPIPAAPQPGGDSHKPGTAVEADQPIAEVRTPGSAVREFGVDNKLDKDFYPHLEKLVTGEKGFPELNNSESLQRILSASEGGSGVHSHHGFIKYEINTEVEVGAERQQVIFEEILDKGGPERAAKYLESLKFSRPQLKYIEDWVGKGKTSAKVDWKAFAAKYKETDGSDHKMVEGLWRSMQGEENQDFANARLTGKGVDLHIHGHIYSFGVDEKGKPILSAVEGKDGYVTKDQMRVVGGRKIAIDKNPDKQMWNNASKINEMQGDHPYREHTENNVPASEMTADERAVLAEIEGDKIKFAQAGAEHVEVLNRAQGVLDSKGHRHPVPIGEGLLGEQRTIKVKTLETFRPSGQVVEALPTSSGNAGETMAAVPPTEQDKQALTNAVKNTADSLGKAGTQAGEFAKGIAKDFGVDFDKQTSGGGTTPDTGAGAKSAVVTPDTTPHEQEIKIVEIVEELPKIGNDLETILKDVSLVAESHFFQVDPGSIRVLEDMVTSHLVGPMESIENKIVAGTALDATDRQNYNYIQKAIATYKGGASDKFGGIKMSIIDLIKESNDSKADMLANGSNGFRLMDNGNERLFISEGSTFTVDKDELIENNSKTGEVIRYTHNEAIAMINGQAGQREKIAQQILGGR